VAIELAIMRIDKGLPLPSYAHPGDAGIDLFSSVDLELGAGERALVGTGIAVAIPDGYAGFIQPRSGLALRSGLSFVNTPGLIDAHYRGEIKVIAINLDPALPIHIARGDRIAQLVIQAVERARVVEVSLLDETVRGEGGFGSSGH
jgi:dUTP pyrophosphatase